MSPSTGGPSVLLWSGGKDAMLALHELNAPGGERHIPEGLGVGPVTHLLTTVTGDDGRVMSHGIRPALLRLQAEALGLELVEVAIPPNCPNTEYEEIMTGALRDLAERGITEVVSGDIMLADIKAYREKLHRRAGLESRFPLWGWDTARVARRTFALNLKTYVVACDGSVLDKSFAGQAYDDRFLARLPAGVDPAGEKGEFHTFVADGPGFRRPVRFRPGDTVSRGGFHYKDLLPAEEEI